MALTLADYHLWRDLKESGLVPPHPCFVELGRANWYGDVDPRVLLEHITDPRTRTILEGAIAAGNLFLIAHLFYGAFLSPSRSFAIDLDHPASIPWDLNRPLPPDFGPCDVLVNSGTGEHVWDQGQFWRTCHALARPGGLMLHAMPLWGWLDHGFVNYQPTFVADLAAANGYEILRWAYSEIDRPTYQLVGRAEDFHKIRKEADPGVSGLMHVVFRRGRGEFKVPQQGYYAGTLSEAMKADWRTLR